MNNAAPNGTERVTKPLPEPSAKARLSRRRVLGGAAGLLGLSVAATGGYAAGIEPKSSW